ncbi:transcriptional regulator domain-containing protein [Brevundimonas faecalis]|uniref:transcriptional regulator domain-containing protein n=1 Tax=Brevundimonas faecalis TaxID=947378 RepID=UPI00361B964A
MTPDTSQWRTASRYEYIEELSPSDIGWEWLRRNEEYQRDYAMLQEHAELSPALSDQVCRKWGVRFPDVAGPPG